MQFNLDVIIFTVFLIINLAIGLLYGKGIKNIRQYAVGDRNFSTAALTATIIATCIGGGFFSGAITETYRQGLYFTIPAIGEPLGLIIVGYFFAPRMAEFFGTLSVAEAMGNMYGNIVRLITALAGISLCIGIVALQFKVSANILQLFFGVSSIYAVAISALIVVLYSALGGIKAVTFTDIIQFFTFGTIIPILSLIIWGTLNDPYKAFQLIKENPLFDYTQVFNINNKNFINSFFLMLFFLIPGFQPVFFQRVIIAKNTTQVRQAFFIAGIVCLIILLAISWVGVLLLSDNPNLKPDTLLAYIIEKHSYPGLKGLTVIGIMSIVMSSADSYINSASVMFVNDILKTINLIKNKVFIGELNISRIFAFFIGISAFYLAFTTGSIFELLLLVLSFYSPIVSVPLLLAILGFRSTSKSVLLGMSGGAAIVIFFKIFNINIEPVIPGMLCNLIILVGSHYLLKQSGGWVGIKDDKPLKTLRIERRRNINNLINSIRNFNFLTFCKNNNPNGETTYLYFGLFCIVSIFSSMYSLPVEVRNQNYELLTFIYHTVLISATIFLSYPIWPLTLKNETFISVAWNIGIFYILTFIGSLLVLISNFDQFQLMIFLINIIMLATTVRWHAALFMIFCGVFIAIKFFKYNMQVQNLPGDIGSLQFKIMYSLLLVTSILIAFIKPKQKQTELIIKRNNYLDRHQHELEEELVEMLNIKQEFLRNIEHETKTPITGTVSLAQSLLECYDKLPKEELIKTVKEIGRSGHRLESWANNLCDLANLNSLKASIEFKQANLSRLVHSRIEFCRRLYETNKHDVEFIYEIEPDIIINCSEYYIKQTVDNLIINTLQYNKKGNITIYLREENRQIKFSIKDEGKGIPEEEIYEVFNPFTVSSSTKTPAGGRGIGLALCKRVIDVHSGRIWAENNEDLGVTFNFIIPNNLQTPNFEQKPNTPLTTQVTRKFLQGVEDRIKKQLAIKLFYEGVDLEIIKKAVGLKDEEIAELAFSKAH